MSTHITGIAPQCRSCDNWVSQDNISGRCVLLSSPELVGKSWVHTNYDASCGEFDPSLEAVEEHAAEIKHQSELRAMTSGRAW